ncbi:MAG: hypothetical protein ACI4O9_08055 [Akkermansia sp.]
MGQFVNSSSNSANYAQQSAEARTNALAQRRQAYANAYALEENSAQSGYITGQQMSTMRQNQSAAIASTRLTNASSGIDASGGSKLRQEQSTAQILEEAIANLGQSYAISDQNARRQAARLRKEGDDAYTIGQIMANYYSRASKIQSTAANWQLLGGGLSTIGDTMHKYNIGTPTK